MRIDEHTSDEGHLGYEKCLQGSANGFWALLIGYFENQMSPKYWLKKLYLALETLWGGGGYFWYIQLLNHCLDQNVLEV